MVYFFASLFSVLIIPFSYFYYKSYQLCGYKTSFVETILLKGLPFGNKNKLKFTKRLIRAVTLHFLLCGVVIFLSFVFLKNTWLIVLDTFLIYLASPLILLIAHLLLLPVENAIKMYYIKQAKAKLACKNVKIIGITGSYGKTSTKNILAHILEKQFKICKTPLNYNTEMGLTKTILQELDDEDFLIAEMGARHKGDIQKLCEIAVPDYCIITTIGPQHLQTFGSMDAIIQTKSEIIANCKKDAVIFVNCDSSGSYEIYKNCRKNKFACNRAEGFAYASDVSYDFNGLSFTLHLPKKSISVKSQLLGAHNVDNIVTASALAYFLGVSAQDIAAAISTLQPTPHRLELIKNKAVCVLDDAYNSNPIGAREALNVLASFKGKRRIVVTPGFVELGQEGVNENFKLGAAIADCADYVLIMNEENKNAILSGLISHNFNKNNIFFASSRQKQSDILKNILCQDAVVLFENDLPDNYK